MALCPTGPDGLRGWNTLCDHPACSKHFCSPLFHRCSALKGITNMPRCAFSLSLKTRRSWSSRVLTSTDATNISGLPGAHCTALLSAAERSVPSVSVLASFFINNCMSVCRLISSGTRRFIRRAVNQSVIVSPEAPKPSRRRRSSSRL